MPRELLRVGPRLRFRGAAPPGRTGRSPAARLQFFGHVAITGRTGQMTVTLEDAADTDLWRVVFDPA